MKIDRYYFKKTLPIAAIYTLISVLGCKKMVQIEPPTNSITTSQVFSDSLDAAAAVAGIYSNTEYGNYGDYNFCYGAQTIFCGLSSDELINFNSDNSLNQFCFNELTPDNGICDQFFWQEPYSLIYQANACIEGLKRSTAISSFAKDQFIGEAEFLRALFYFYLVNMYDNIPYVNSTTWSRTSLSKQITASEMYSNIITDLKDAQLRLLNSYSFSHGKRTRANRYAATALLARVYLYQNKWDSAEAQASAIISNTGTFNLPSDLNTVFSVNSTEAILQWPLNTSFYYNNATSEGWDFVPYDQTSPPQYYLNLDLLNAFEPGDLRKIAWTDSTNYSGTIYYYPYKYKIGSSQALPNTSATEQYTVLRLAEQYLIRAEARARQGSNLSGAINDLNALRNRANLTLLPSSLTQQQVLDAVMHERRIELFAEWGHRWFDLKRTGQVNPVMTLITPQKNGGTTWNSYQRLYPIPQSELSLDPNLKQNPGY